MSNRPPHAVLELDQRETVWLYKMIAAAERTAHQGFSEACAMRSTDPRASMRSMLTMAATIDMSVADQLASRLENQDGSLERSDVWAEEPADE